MYNAYILSEKYVWYKCRVLHAAACIKKRKQVTEVIYQLCSMQLQKEVKSNPKTAKL